MSIATHALPLDLHVLGLPLAFILSQDQTLLCIFSISLSSILGLRFLLRNQRSRICFRYFACTAYSSLVNELPMSVRNRSRASFPLAPGPLWCPSFRTGLQRYCFFPNLQIFLDFFLTFFPAEGRRGTLRTGPGTAQRAVRQRNHGERGGAGHGCDFFEGGRQGDDTPDRPPGSILRKYRGRWCIRCITWLNFPTIPWKVGRK